MRAFTTTMPLTQVRWRGRVPRLAFVGACAVLCLNGLRNLAASDTPPAPARVAHALDLVDARGLATQYAIDYLTFVPNEDERRVVRLSALGAAEDTVAQDRAGVIPSRVTFATPVAESRTANGADITVAARRGDAWIYLRVPVSRQQGRLSIPAAPSVVGAPPVARGRLTVAEDEVQDRALVAAAGRTVRHYLHGDRTDLAADLDRGVVVDVPRRWLTVTRVDRTTWTRPGRRVAVGVSARAGNGLRLSLRYELSVVRRSGRWLVTAIGTQTMTNNKKESHR